MDGEATGIEQVVVLTVNVTAHCDALLLRGRDLGRRGRRRVYGEATSVEQVVVLTAHVAAHCLCAPVGAIAWGNGQEHEKQGRWTYR